MRRVSIVGNSGSGKTTLARQLDERLEVPHVELDGIFHQPGWQELPTAEFRARVEAVAETPGWVIDGNYNAVRDIVWRHADTVVFLDLPRGRVMRQVTKRTLGRLLLRRELWNGNREPWSNVTSHDPNRSILAWAWRQHDKYRQRYGEAQGDPANAHLRFVFVRNRSDAEALLTDARRP